MLPRHEEQQRAESSRHDDSPSRRLHADEHLHDNADQCRAEEQRAHDAGLGPQVEESVVRARLRRADEAQAVAGRSEPEQERASVRGQEVEQLRPLGEPVVVGAERIGIGARQQPGAEQVLEYLRCREPQSREARSGAEEQDAARAARYLLHDAGRQHRDRQQQDGRTREHDDERKDAEQPEGPQQDTPRAIGALQRQQRDRHQQEHQHVVREFVGVAHQVPVVVPRQAEREAPQDEPPGKAGGFELRQQGGRGLPRGGQHDYRDGQEHHPAEIEGVPQALLLACRQGQRRRDERDRREMAEGELLERKSAVEPRGGRHRERCEADRKVAEAGRAEPAPVAAAVRDGRAAHGQHCDRGDQEARAVA